MKRTAALLAVTAVVITACGGGDDATETTTIADPGAAVLSVTSEGGFVPVEFNLDRMPRYLVTGDRTLYYQGPVPAIFPGPILANVQVTSIDAASWDEIMDLVERLGLPDIDERIDNSGAEMVADASTEFITYYDESGAHRLGVYALGLTEGAGSDDRLFAGEIVEILDGATATGESTTYTPDRLQVAAGPGTAEPGISTVEPWPIETAFAEMDDWGAGWSCTTVEGDSVESLLATFSAANQATLWDTGSETLAIRARPLLPGETGCGGAPQGMSG
ncbi:MAG: hypothetical protein ACRDVD_08645 [Acidimicrobiia bacterium]